MDTVTAVISAVGSVLAGIGAIGAWFAARQSRDTSRAIAATDRQRRHRELLPQFEVTCVTENSRESATLTLNLVDPPDLDRLDEITVSIRDDMTRTASGIAGGPNAEQVAQTIWGPLRFTPGVNGADRFGRTVEPFSLALGDWTRRALERSLPPSWTDAEAWRRDYQKKPEVRSNPGG